MIEFYDVNGRKRKAESVKVIAHEVPNAITGEMVTEYYVEVVIAGNVRKWKEWYPLEDFRKRNPEIELEEA